MIPTNSAVPALCQQHTHPHVTLRDTKSCLVQNSAVLTLSNRKISGSLPT